MVLFRRDDRIVRFAHVGHLFEELRHLVVLGDRFADGFVRVVDAELFGQRGDEVLLDLFHVELRSVWCDFQRGVDDAVGELRVLDEVQFVDVLHDTDHLLAGVGRRIEVEEIVSAFERALEQRAGIAADEAGHVVLADVERPGVRGAQPYRESISAVQKDFRNIVAGVADRDFAVVFRLHDQFVVRLLEEVFKKLQVFEVSHRITVSFLPI